MQNERFWWETDLLVLTDRMLDSFKIDSRMRNVTRRTATRAKAGLRLIFRLGCSLRTGSRLGLGQDSRV